MAQRAVLAGVAAALAACPPAAAAQLPAGNTATVTLATAAPLFTYPPDWLGVNIDLASVHNGLDLGDPYLVALLRQLRDAANGTAPITLRVGGTSSNAAIYSPDGSGTASTIISDATLAALHGYAQASGARIHPFGLRYMTDPATGRWSPALNASALWAHVWAANLTSFASWSLGNELLGEVNVTTYTADYNAFAQAVQALAPPWARTVYGPSAAGFPGSDVIAPIVQGAGAALAASGGGLSFHAYAYKNCSAAWYLNKLNSERMDYYYQNYAGLRDALMPGLPLYLEEFATSAAGGCEGLSDRFISGFWWLHSLGLAGERGIAKLTRQDLVGWSFNSEPSRYPLAGPPGWNNRSQGLPTPHPDWFTFVLWRQLVGTRVLNVTTATSPATVNDTLALHAWCANQGYPGEPGAPLAPGAVVLVYVNFDAAPVALQLDGGLAASPRIEFTLTPLGGTNVTADAALLNGQLLAVDDNGLLPQLPLPGAAVAAGSPAPLSAPPLSYGFVVLPQAAAPACL